MTFITGTDSIQVVKVTVKVFSITSSESLEYLILQAICNLAEFWGKLICVLRYLETVKERLSVEDRLTELLSA